MLLLLLLIQCKISLYLGAGAVFRDTTPLVAFMFIMCTIHV